MATVVGVQQESLDMITPGLALVQLGIGRLLCLPHLAIEPLTDRSIRRLIVHVTQLSLIGSEILQPRLRVIDQVAAARRSNTNTVLIEVDDLVPAGAIAVVRRCLAAPIVMLLIPTVRPRPRRVRSADHFPEKAGAVHPRMLRDSPCIQDCRGEIDVGDDALMDRCVRSRKLAQTDRPVTERGWTVAMTVPP